MVQHFNLRFQASRRDQFCVHVFYFAVKAFAAAFVLCTTFKINYFEYEITKYEAYVRAYCFDEAINSLRFFQF